MVYRPPPAVPSKIEVIGDMAKIYISDDIVALIDADDVPKIEDRKWRLHSAGYVVWGVSRGGKARFEYLHRVVTNITGRFVDHINGDKLDCRKSNLRAATQQQNTHNVKRHKDNSTGFKGVSIDKRSGRYEARIMVNRKKIHLGYFDRPEDAHAAYCEAAIKYHKEFARFE